jgi:hypothetical protein
VLWVPSILDGPLLVEDASDLQAGQWNTISVARERREDPLSAQAQQSGADHHASDVVGVEQQAIGVGRHRGPFE